MGPTNVALVKLFRADQELRAAQERLDAAEKNVRVQDRRTHDLAERLRLAQAKLRQRQADAGRLDLDLKSRDAHIEKLRTQQQTTKHHKEYQAFLVEINTAKVDRGKIEDEAVKVMEEVEKGQQELQAMQAQLDGERKKLEEMKQQSGEVVGKLKAEVEALKPARQAAAEALPPKARAAFERLAEHHDEAMAAIAKPDRRREEYLCTACNMDLVTDVYNKLHSRDDLVFCPSCRRILYIPEDLPPEAAIKTKSSRGSSSSSSSASGRASGASSSKAADASEPGSVEAAPPPPRPKIEPRAKGKLGEILAATQGECVRGARDADQKPVELEVTVDGKLAGIYKGKSADHFERVLKYRLGEAKMEASVQVTEKRAEQPAEAPVAEAPAIGTTTEAEPPVTAGAGAGADAGAAGESQPG